jgi:hypothetical protein
LLVEKNTCGKRNLSGDWNHMGSFFAKACTLLSFCCLKSKIARRIRLEEKCAANDPVFSAATRAHSEFYNRISAKIKNKL